MIRRGALHTIFGDQGFVDALGEFGFRKLILLGLPCYNRCHAHGVHDNKYEPFRHSDSSNYYIARVTFFAFCSFVLIFGF
jgi:hypothetical protein